MTDRTNSRDSGRAAGAGAQWRRGLRLPVLALVLLALWASPVGAVVGLGGGAGDSSALTAAPVELSFDTTLSAADWPTLQQRSTIVGGELASGPDWPWAAIVVVYSNGAPEFLCSGSLIGEQWIATAAHCAFDENDALIPNLGFLVAIGYTDFTTPASDAVFVPSGIIWPYNPATIENDLLLLRLPAPTTKRAVRLAGQSEAATHVAGSPAAVIGYGQYGLADSDVDLHLRLANATVESDEHCSMLRKGFVPATMLCGGAPTGSSATPCFGDSGGPFMAPDPFGTYVQLGVTSWGVKCGNPPYVLTEIAAFSSVIAGRLATNADAPATAPVAVTGTAVPSATTAAVSGTVSPGGLATSFLVEYGPTTSYGKVAYGTYVGAGKADVPVALSLPGLKANTTYHYRVAAVNVAGLSAGADGVLRTTGLADSKPPTVKALASSGSAGTTVALRYRAWDALSPRTRERIRIRRADGTLVATVTTRFSRGARGTVRTARWRAPAGVVGRLRFCVDSTDRAGNRSRASCAPLVLS